VNSTAANPSRAVTVAFYIGGHWRPVGPTPMGARVARPGLALEKRLSPLFFRGLSSPLRLAPLSQAPGPPQATKQAQHGYLELGQDLIQQPNSPYM
jgi:hypothetical protein